MHPKITDLIHFRGQFASRKPKTLLKNQNFWKKYTLRNINNVSFRPQKNHILLLKLSKSIFGPKLGMNFPLGLRQRVISNSHKAYNRTIHLYAKFQLLGICCSRLYPGEKTMFFLFRTQLPQSVGLGCGVCWQ